MRVTAIVASTVAVFTGLAVPAAAQAPGNSDDCTLTWVQIEELEPDYYFGDARLQCPVKATVGGRWELDGQEVRSFTEQQGPGEVAVFDDLDRVFAPGRELCFIATAWFGDKGKDCLTT